MSIVNGSETNDSGRLWLADLLFRRANRTVKYGDNGELLIVSEAMDWSDIWPRLEDNVIWIGVFCASIVLNFMILLFSFTKGRQLCHRKVQCLIANLAFCNIMLSSGFLIYVFLIDIYYDVDSFDTLIALNEDTTFASVWPIAKKIVHDEMVENFATVQSFVLLSIAGDRYLSLLDSYSPFLRHPLYFITFSFLIPYVVAFLFLDSYILYRHMGASRANIVRLFVLLSPPLLSSIFMGCILARFMQKHKLGLANDSAECMTAITFTLITVAQLMEKFGVFFELMSRNLMYEIVVGFDQRLDDALRRALDNYYEIAHILLLASPLYTPLLVLTLVSFYRRRLTQSFRKFCNKILCRKRPKVDYSAETMRSIFAEQTRNRQMRLANYSR